MLWEGKGGMSGVMKLQPKTGHGGSTHANLHPLVTTPTEPKPDNTCVYSKTHQVKPRITRINVDSC